MRNGKTRGAIVEPTAEAQEGWIRTILDTAVDMAGFARECTPGYYNNGAKDLRSNLGQPYGPGFYAFGRVLREWREAGTLDGMRIGGMEN